MPQECFDKGFCVNTGSDCTKEKMERCRPKVIEEDPTSILYVLSFQYATEGKDIGSSSVINMVLETFYKLGGNWEEARRIIRMAYFSANKRMHTEVEG